VRFSDGWEFKRATLGAVLISTIIGWTACTRQSAATPPDAATLLQSIASGDSSKYPSLQESKHWGNPYLVIRADKVGLLSGVAASEEVLLKPEEVLNALAQLPPSAWPYGRAVAILVDEKRASSETDKIALRKNRGIVEGDLQGAHVAIRWIPGE
jgi:hypothetical protein